jgi:hypothetical protein
MTEGNDEFVGHPVSHPISYLSYSKNRRILIDGSLSHRAERSWRCYT